MPKPAPMNYIVSKSLLLGTAQWGWTVSRAAAFQLLDAWLKAGHRSIDAATNYPINKNPEQFRAAENILLEYIRAHGLQDLEITMKIGSLNNMRTPDINLSPSFILMMGEEYLQLFGKNLHAVMLHWDNRSSTTEITASVQALQQLQENTRIRPGLSGIKHPEFYADVLAGSGIGVDIQLKHNIFQSDLPRYQAILDSRQACGHRFYAYGINAGGVKLEGPYPADSTFLQRGGDPSSLTSRLEKLKRAVPEWNLAFVRPPVRTMNHIGLIYGGLHPELDGLVLGFSSPNQLQETTDFWRNLETFDYSDIFKALNRLHGSQTSLS
ncbi:MAG: hypothetical protein EP344_18760 [Bacteroidetes bacterium]|nr:MAG: hypothetical protein EP344_18760 [Bacteroidota bacterium]